MTPNDDCQEKCQQTNIESATTKNAPDEKTQQIGSKNDPRKVGVHAYDAAACWSDFYVAKSREIEIF